MTSSSAAASPSWSSATSTPARPPASRRTPSPPSTTAASPTPPAPSNAINQTVNRANTNINPFTVTPAGNATYGQQLTFTATINQQFSGGTLAGTVTFFSTRDGVTNPVPGGSNVPVVGNTATFQTTELPAGQHTLFAVYTDNNDATGRRQDAGQRQ